MSSSEETEQMSLSVLLGSHVPSVIFPGVGAMPMICQACFSLLGHQRLLPRPVPHPLPGLVL